MPCKMRIDIKLYKKTNKTMQRMLNDTNIRNNYDIN